jgi:chorismate mutase/prephenate dehydratase
MPRRPTTRRTATAIDADLRRLLDERAALFAPGKSFPADEAERILGVVASTCQNLAAPPRVAYLGPEATYSHQAAISHFGTDARFAPQPRITDIFQVLVRGEVDYGVVPIENSTGGTVHETLDAFIQYDCRIQAEIHSPIHHCLLSKNTPLAKIAHVYAHPQSFLQCREWLKKNLPNAEQVVAASNAAGMQLAREHKGSACIGGELGAQIYGLKILARHIEDTPDNTTRFLVIAMQDGPRTGRDATSLMFSIKDRPGILFDLLKPFAERGINLSKIESRPTKRKAWEYVFFIDVAGHRLDPKVAEAIGQLEQHCHWMRVMGSYERRAKSEG